MSDQHEVGGIRIIKDLLQHIRIRPAMYLGRRSVHDLEVFLMGYSANGGDISEYYDEYADFLRKKFKITSTIGWSKIIEFQAYGEEEQWNLFEKTWSEYEQGRDRKNKKGTRKSGVSGRPAPGHSGAGPEVSGTGTGDGQ